MNAAVSVTSCIRLNIGLVRVICVVEISAYGKERSLQHGYDNFIYTTHQIPIYVNQIHFSLILNTCPLNCIHVLFTLIE